MRSLTYLFVHKDYPIDVHGVNSGAETATLWLVRTLAAQGKRVILAAQLKHPELSQHGVEYWDLGPHYDVGAVLNRASELGPYRLFAACRALPLILSSGDRNCVSRHLMAHDPSAAALGVAPKVVSHYVDSVFCVSQAQADLFIKEGLDGSLITVLPNGANREVFKPTSFASRNLKRIVFAGALVTDKGVDLLIKAFMTLKQSIPDATLDIYGSSSMWGRGELFDQKALMQAIPGLVFHGSVSQSTVADAFGAAAVTVIPSRWFDSFPLTAVEAQSTGSPVVAFNVGGMREALVDGETGVIVPEVSEDQLAQALIALLQNPARLQQLSKNAERLVRERFSWTSIANRLIAAVEQPKASTATKSTPVAVLSTWNQNCGLATYARYLFGSCEAGELILLSEKTEAALTRPDEPFVNRCWSRTAQDFSQLKNQLKRSGARILHCNLHSVSYFRTEALTDLLGWARENGIKVVTHLHSTFTTEPGFGPITRFSDLILVHAEQNRLEVIAHGASPDQVEVFEHGVDLLPTISTEQREANRKQFGVAPGEKLLVSFGFIQPHKGMEGLIEAVAYLRTRGVPARGVIAGSPNKDDPNAERYAQLLRTRVSELKVDSFIHFTSGFLAESTVSAYLQAADLVLMNYRSQHFEASGACSLAVGAGAVVMTSLAPPFMSFGDAVWKITAGYPIPVAAELLLSNQTLYQTVQQRALSYAQKYSWAAMNERLRELYRKCLGLTLAPGTTLAALKPEEQPPVKPVRVLIQNRPNTFTQRGGDTIVIERTIEELRKLGVEVSTDFTGTISPKGFDIVHLFNFALPELTRHFAEQAVAAGVPYVVTTLNEDIPQFHNQSVVVADALIKYVASGQNPAVWDNARQHFGSVPAAQRFQNDWTASHAAALLTNGNRETASIRRDYPQTKRIVEVPLGYSIGAKADRSLFIETYGVKDFVLCVGRLESRKNQLMLLKALEGSDVTVVLAAGGFTYQPEYAEAVRRFRRVGKTLVLDRLDPAMLASAYAAAKVHALPSWYELPGLVSLEAAAFGCSVVAADCGTARDYLGDFAHYCNPQDEQSILNAVRRALSEPSQTALQNHVKKFQWEQIGSNTIKVYQEVLGKVVQGSPSTREASMSTTNLSMSQQPSAIVSYDMSSEATDFQELLERGELAGKNEELVKANELFERAELINPSSMRLMKGRGAVFLADGKTELAQHYFSRAFRMGGSTDPRILCGLGMCAMRSDKLKEAQGHFVSALSIAPDTQVAVLQLVAVAYALGEYTELEKALRNYLQLHSEDLDMQYCLAGALMKQGKFVEAESIARGIVARKPDHKNGCDLVAILSAREQPKAATSPVAVTQTKVNPSLYQMSLTPAKPAVNDTSSSATTLSTMVQKVASPSSAQHSTRSAQVDTELGRLEEAKRLQEYDEVRRGCEELLKRNDLVADQHDLAMSMKAEMLVLDGEVAQAREIYETVLSSSPSFVRAICGKAVIFAHEGKWTESQTLFERARTMQPRYDLALAGLGLCALMRSDNETAWTRFSEALESNCENTRALLGLIQLGYPMKRYVQLEAAIRAYLDLHPADLEWVYSLAGVCFAQNKFNEAREAVEQITLFKPDHEKAIELRRMIDERQGSSSRA